MMHGSSKRSLGEGIDKLTANTRATAGRTEWSRLNLTMVKIKDAWETKR